MTAAVDTSYWRTLAPQTHQVEIEIGPGNGQFLRRSARRRADTLFVGIELRQAWAERLRKKLAEIDNAVVVCGDARCIVEHLLADASIDRFHLYFPDPWWKKRHHKRRLWSERFCRAAARVLKPGGELLLVTDVPQVFDAASTELVKAGLTRCAWTRADDDEAQSAYERKYRRQGRRLWQAAFAKT